MARLLSQLRKTTKEAKSLVPKPRKLPETAQVVEEQQLSEEEIRAKRDAASFKTIEVMSSKGKKYKVVVPSSYARLVPSKWEWDIVKYRVAEMIAEGIPLTKIVEDPEIGVKSRMTIYGWLEHPEFREHVDALITETGFASQRERIAGLARMTQRLFDKLMNEIDKVKITDKSIGAVIQGIQNGMKQLAQEKGEFIEQQNVTQQTNINGALGVAQVDVQQVLASKTDEERRKLEEEFDRIGDEIIRSLTGDKV